MQANPVPSGGEGVGVWAKTRWLTNANSRDEPETRRGLLPYSREGPHVEPRSPNRGPHGG